MQKSISLRGVSATTADGRLIFSQLDLTFAPHRTGVVGRNGVGKSTLLHLIAGDLPPASGSVEADLHIGMLRQEVAADPDATIAAAFFARADLARLARIEAGNGSDDDLALADWTLPQRLAAGLERFDLGGFEPERRLSTLSGGQRTRVALAALVFDAPDLLLLDEPTNNLDADGREAVMHLLEGWKAGAIVVSHDRQLLRCMDAIVELTSLGAATYGGNFDAYAERKAMELAAAEQSLATAERQVEDIDRRIQMRAERKARSDSRGKQARRRTDIPRILMDARKDRSDRTSGSHAALADKMRAEAGAAAADARARVEIVAPIALTLEPTGLAAGTRVLEAIGLTGGYDSAMPVIRDFSLTLIGPERVALTGPNGSGKSTLLRLMTGRLAPSKGSVRFGVPHATLDQEVSLLDPALSVLDNYMRLNPGDDLTAGRTALARLRFRADAALTPAGALSGGEKLRAGLAVTIGAGRPPGLLFLDEPSNHLDFEAIAALEAGLRDYDGALLVISHDRALIEAIGITREIRL